MAAARDLRRDSEQLLNAVQLACESGDLEPLKAALQVIPIDASHRDIFHGQTCMHLACSIENAAVVRFLLQNGAGKLLYSGGSTRHSKYPISLVETADVMFTLLELHPELVTHQFVFTQPILCRATEMFVRGKGGWTLDKIKRLVEVYGCPVDAPSPLYLSALAICFCAAVSPNSRALFWYLVGQKAQLSDNSSYRSHFRSLSVMKRNGFSEEGRSLNETPAEAYDDLMRYLVVERGLDIDEAKDHPTALSFAIGFGKSGPAALLIRWGASVWLALSAPSQLPTLSPEDAATIKDAIRQRAYAKRARLVAAYRYPRKHSNVRRWEREEEKQEKQPIGIETTTGTDTAGVPARDGDGKL
jgi:Ankyrin repeat